MGFFSKANCIYLTKFLLELENWSIWSKTKHGLVSPRRYLHFTLLITSCGTLGMFIEPKALFVKREWYVYLL